MKTKIKLVDGVEGNSFYIGDYRVAGNKPWGGGRVIYERSAFIKDIVCSLNNMFNPAHQPLGSISDEIDALRKAVDTSKQA